MILFCFNQNFDDISYLNGNLINTLLIIMFVTDEATVTYKLFSYSLKLYARE